MADAPQLPPTVDPGVIPLGYSYCVGQGRLHMGPGGKTGDPPPQPGGDYLNAYRDKDLLYTIWGIGASGYPALADIVNQLAGQGPIPPDTVVTDMTTIQVRIDQGFWNKQDQITIEHHVYWMGFREGRSYFASGGAAGRSPANAAGRDAKDLMLLLQISGYSSKQNKWILPNQQGIPIAWYHLKEGTELWQGQWEHYVTNDEITTNQAFQNTWMQATTTAVSIIGSMFGAGGVAGRIGQIMADSLPAIINAAATGNSDGLLSSLENVAVGIGGEVINDTATTEALKQKILGMGQFGNDLITYTSTAGKTVKNVVKSVEDGVGMEVKGLVVGAQNHVNTLLSQAETGIPGSAAEVAKEIVRTRDYVYGGINGDDVGLATLNTLQLLGKPLTQAQLDNVFGIFSTNLDSQFDGLVGQTAIDRSRAILGVPAGVPIGQAGIMFGGQFASVAGQTIIPTNPAAYFFDLAMTAPTGGDLPALALTVPDYAQEYFVMGATLRAAQLAQQDAPRFRKLYATLMPRPNGGIPGASFLTRIQQVVLASTIARPTAMGGS